MGGRGSYIVIDIGKTVSKVSSWDRAGQLIDRSVRPNAPCVIGGVRRLDVQGIGNWLVDALGAMAGASIEAIIPVGHGAGVVALDADGPAFAPLDYEQPLPADVLASYRRERDPFAMTGSPALPDGLNMGAQLHWLESSYPREMERSALVPWAQYWAWFLSGEAVSEVTSLGCHSDLWCPDAADFAPMAIRRGWAGRFAPLARAGDVIGTIRPQLAERTGLPATTRILAGLHDSNAALVAARGQLGSGTEEATVLSTGTWFVAMRLTRAPSGPGSLHEARDTLVNVDIARRPVPSGRFMGGREIEQVVISDERRVDIAGDQAELVASVPELLSNGTMLLPTLAPGCGPFPAHRARWSTEPADWSARRAAACLYAALVADATLGLIGSRGPLLIEGRFTEAEVFVRALAALRSDVAVLVSSTQGDVSFGALRLIDPALAPQGTLRRIEPLDGDVTGYATTWHAACGNPG